MFQNGVNCLSKMVIKNPIFFLLVVKKLKISCCLDHTILFKFCLSMIQTFFKESMEKLQTSNFSNSNDSTEEFKWQIYCKNDFPIGYLMLPLLMLTLKDLKSLHTLFDKYLDHMLVKFEQTIQFFLLFTKKWLTISDKVSTSF